MSSSYVEGITPTLWLISRMAPDKSQSNFQEAFHQPKLVESYKRLFGIWSTIDQ